jgi:hypothetical protein
MYSSGFTYETKIKEISFFDILESTILAKDKSRLSDYVMLT